jgi:hypothetical protein
MPLLDIWITIRCEACSTPLLEERANANTRPEAWGQWVFDHVIAPHMAGCRPSEKR